MAETKENTLVLSVCQRPKRAFFISTPFQIANQMEINVKCQRPKRAFFISTLKSLQIKSQAEINEL